jgi:glycine betaine/proline transport system ATP-binding protein
MVQSESGDAIVLARDIWKIFGRNPAPALAAARSGRLTKDQIRDQLNAIVGVAGVSFELKQGEFFCIMGLSGSGKSTLLRHINRLVEPTSGTILVGGRDISELSHRELLRLRSEKIGMVFQNTAVFPHRTVRENVAFGLEVRGLSRAKQQVRIAEVLELVQLAGWENHYPHTLSGGMRQRVGLARALATDADVLLMDEPFGALDPLIRRQLQTEFLTLTRRLGKTTIFITHDLDEAIRLGDRIAVMKEGKFVQIGSPEAIVTAPADDYVADFVRGISRLKLVKARSIMQPGIDLHHHLHPRTDPRLLRTVSEDADLERLIGATIGIITIVDLLNGIRGSIDGATPEAAVTHKETLEVVYGGKR